MVHMQIISINVSLMGTFLRNIQVTCEHAQLKGGEKDPIELV